MARTFVSASTQHLTGAFAPITAAPMTVSAWINPDLVQNSIAVCIGDASVNNNHVRLIVRADGQIRWQARGVTIGQAVAGLASAGVWSHIGGVEHSTTSRFAWLNGVSGVEEATEVILTGFDQTRVATVNRLALEIFDGAIAEVGIWNIALNDGELIRLSRGYTPLGVRRQNLVFYLPLRDARDIDLISHQRLTAVNSPGVTNHPKLIVPKRRIVKAPVAVGHANRLINTTRLTSKVGGVLV